MRRLIPIIMIGMILPQFAFARNGDNKTPKSAFAYSFEACSFTGGGWENGAADFMTNLDDQGYIVTQYVNDNYDNDPEGCTIANLVNAGHSGVLGVLYAHTNGVASDIEVYSTAAARDDAFDAYVAAGWNPGGIVEIRKDDTTPGKVNHYNVTMMDLGFSNRLKPQTDSWDTIVILSGCCNSVGLFDDIGGRVRFANAGCPDAGDPNEWAFNLKLLLERMSGFQDDGDKRPAGDAFNAGGFKPTFRMDGEGKTTLAPAVLSHEPTGLVQPKVVATGKVVFDTEVSDLHAATDIISVTPNVVLDSAAWTVPRWEITFHVSGIDSGDMITVTVDEDEVLSLGSLQNLDGNTFPIGSDGKRRNQDDFVWGFSTQASAPTVPDRSGLPVDSCYVFGGKIGNATIWADAGSPGVPAEDVWLETELGGLIRCTGGTIADRPTDDEGVTTFTQAYAAGHYSDQPQNEMTIVVSNGIMLSEHRFGLYFNSPDINGDLVVNLTDVVLLAYDFHTQYHYRSDFYWDGVINLSDVVYMARAMGTTCPAKIADVSGLPRAGRIGFYFDKAGTRSTLAIDPNQTFTGYIYADGLTADAGIQGWQCQLEMSRNIVVDAWEYPDKTLNVLDPPRFMVGIAGEPPSREFDGKQLLAWATMRVTDQDPAYIYINRNVGDPGEGNPLVCTAGAEHSLCTLGWPDDGSPADPVAAINDPATATGQEATPKDMLVPGIHATPNPFNPVTAVTFSVEKQEHVRIAIFDVRGRQVAVLANRSFDRGNHSVDWKGVDSSGRSLPSGTYFVRMDAAGKVETKKIALVR